MSRQKNKAIAKRYGIDRGEPVRGGASAAGIRDYAMAFRRAAHERVPPDELAGMITEGLEISLDYARRKGSVIGMVKMLELFMSYVMGEPTRQVEVNVNDMSQTIAVLMERKGPLLPPIEKEVPVIEHREREGGNGKERKEGQEGQGEKGPWREEVLTQADINKFRPAVVDGQEKQLTQGEALERLTRLYADMYAQREGRRLAEQPPPPAPLPD